MSERGDASDNEEEAAVRQRIFRQVAQNERPTTVKAALDALAHVIDTCERGFVAGGGGVAAMACQTDVHALQRFAFFPQLTSKLRMMHANMAKPAPSGSLQQRALWHTAARPPWPAAATAGAAAAGTLTLEAALETWEHLLGASFVLAYHLPERCIIAATFAWFLDNNSGGTDPTSFVVLFLAPVGPAAAAAVDIILRDRVPAFTQPLRYWMCAHADPILTSGAVIMDD